VSCPAGVLNDGDQITCVVGIRVGSGIAAAIAAVVILGDDPVQSGLSEFLTVLIAPFGAIDPAARLQANKQQ